MKHMTKLLPHGNQDHNIQAGFSLVELMIAVTLGLIIMTGLVSIFVKNSLARSEIERSNRQLESGRYAMSLLTEDLRMAGFLATFDPHAEIIGSKNPPTPFPPLGANPPTDPGITDITLVDPCATSVANLNKWYFFHVQGYDNAATIPSCISDVRTGTDILVVRRVSTCVAGPTLEAGCDPLPAGAPYFQSSDCYNANELAFSTGDPLTLYLAFFILDTDTTRLTDPAQTRHKLNCTAVADYRRFLTHIYFVANNNVAGDGIPTLKRAELGAGGFTIVPLVEGIETIQFEYGVDTNNDGVIDGFTANPTTYNGCAGTACVFNWLRTYSVKVNLLARNVEPSPGWTDNKTYTLGLKADGTANVFPATGTYADAYKRHAYNATVRLDNPQGRVQP
jgi:type IV pilus assembly protein PilW